MKDVAIGFLRRRVPVIRINILAAACRRASEILLDHFNSNQFISFLFHFKVHCPLEEGIKRCA